MKLKHTLLSTSLTLAFIAAPLAAQTIHAYAGTADPGFSGDGGPAKAALFNAPGPITLDGAGGLYIVDTNNVRIRRVTADGIVRTVAGTGEAEPTLEGPASLSTFISVYDIAIDPNANLHIADADGLQKVDALGNLSFVVTGQSVPGLAISTKGAIYEGGITVVWKLEADGTSTAVAGTELGDSGDGGPATGAAFFISALTTDRLGNVYILDGESSRVRKFLPGGVISTVAGNGIADFTGDGGPATQASLNFPQGIAVDVAGNVYIGDTSNSRIRKVTADGIITTFAGQTENSEESGDEGPASQAFFFYPNRLAVSCTSLYIADDQRIRTIDLTAPLIALDGIATLTAQKFSITGCNLATDTLTADPTLPLPTILGNATVTVNGFLATLVSVSPTQIVAILPPGLAAGEVKVSVLVNGAKTTEAAMNIN